MYISRLDQGISCIFKMSKTLNLHLKSYGISLEHCTDRVKFRTVKALRHFHKGANIISSQPLATLLLPYFRQKFCNYCFLEAPKLQRCSRCKAFFVCGNECFRKAWIGWHQWLCEEESNNDDIDSMTWEDDKPSEDSMDEEMLKRVAVAVLASNSSVCFPLPSNETFSSLSLPTETSVITKEAFGTLMSHAQSQTPETFNRFKNIANTAKSSAKFSAVSSSLTIFDLITYLCRFRCNNFSIHDNQLFVIGEGTYPIGSLFNHSCRPNAIVLYEGPVQIIHAIEDIEIGDEITISYVDVVNLRSERSSILREKYFFECKCERCQDDPPEENIEWCGVKRRGLESIDELLLGRLEHPPSSLPNLSEIRADNPMYQHPTDDEISQYIAQQLLNFDIGNYRTILIDRSQHLNLLTFTAYVHQTLLPATYYREAPADISLMVATTLIDLIYRFPAVPEGMPNPTTLKTLRAATRFQNHLISVHEWEMAANCAVYVMAVYLMVYSRYHPMIGLQSFTIGKCFWNAEKLGVDGQQWAECYLHTAMCIISVAYGESSSIYKQINELHDIVLQELKAKGITEMFWQRNSHGKGFLSLRADKQ